MGTDSGWRGVAGGNDDGRGLRSEGGSGRHETKRGKGKEKNSAVTFKGAGRIKLSRCVC